MTLNKGQQLAKDIIDQGGNCFILGSAGVGKSFLMREITTKNTILCAPTGAAALQIGGVTAASLFGLPIGVCLDSDRMKPSRKLEELFSECKVDRIILDEVSMIRSDQLSLIDAKLRNVTKKDIPFGGIQMVFVGDLFQLPPIVGKTEAKVFYQMYKSPWVFTSMSWEMADIKTVMLTEIMRQEDREQQSILSSLREKDANWVNNVEKLNDISSQRPVDGIWLCSYNKTVDMINMSRYREVQGEERTYKGINKNFKPHECPVPETISLKVGCRVLIKANAQDGTYVNGTTGTVRSLHDEYIEVETITGASIFVEPFSWEKYEYVMGLTGLERKKVASFKQFPVKLGYSLSTHSSQGCTLENVNIDFGRGTFSAGQAYVALSRVKDLTKMYVQGGLNYSDIIVDDEVKEFYDKIS